MAFYIVENEEASINNWGCYWIVKANNAKEAIDKVYKDENDCRTWENPNPTNADYRRTAKITGIQKNKLYAYAAEEAVKDVNTYRIK